MKLRYEQLATHLQKNILPIYLISGNDPFFLHDACDTFRSSVRQAGYHERQIHSIDTHFDWQFFFANINNLSLFSNKQLHELRFSQVKLNEVAVKTLQDYARSPTSNMVLLLIMPKLEAAAQKTAWFRCIDTCGAIIQIWPLELQHMPQWITQRLQRHGITTTSEGIKLLVEKTEGNLLAANQEIEKLYMLYGANTLTTKQIAVAIADHARFDIFDLVDSCLQGNSQRVLRIISALKNSAIEPTLILWALTKELRILALMAYEMGQGKELATLFKEQRIWEKRQPLLRRCLQRGTLHTWQMLLSHAAYIDRLIKGAAHGNVWDKLTELSILLSGKTFLSTQHFSPRACDYE